MYLWSIDMTLKNSRRELKICKMTCVDWYRFCRDIAYFHFEGLENEDEYMIGGDGKIVEIDESLLSRRKYHRGRKVEQV